MSASQVTALTSLAEPIVAAHDCELEGITIRRAGRRRLVRIVVDHTSGHGLTLDLVASISRDLSRQLDDSPVLGESAYVLEVTSPGVDRPMTSTRQWTRAVGRVVRVVPRLGEPLEGRLTFADDDSVVLDVGEATRTVARADVLRATVQVEFTRTDDAESADADADADEPSDTPEEG